MTTPIWLAEAQSSQRDMLLSLQALKSRYDLTLIASHRHARPEILGCADIAYTEPSDSERVAFVVRHAIDHYAKVLLTGRNSKAYEPYRQTLADKGVRLLTGASDENTLTMLDDKFAFAQACKAQGIAVADGKLVQNFDELTSAICQYGDTPLCIKPTCGIFAQGFWILDNDTDPFYHLYDTEPKRIATQSFLHAYQNSPLANATPMILMPYLSGVEHSVDVVCERGEVLGAVCRHKVEAVQYVGYDEAVMAQVIKVIHAFGCDGIVSVQTKADDLGEHHILEINTRPSGGIGYTVHCGLDLTQLAFLYFGGLIDKPDLSHSIAQITPCTVRPLMTCVKI